MKKFTATMIVLLACGFATGDTKAQSSDDEQTAAFVGVRVNENGERFGLVGVAAEIAPRIISISRSDFGGTTNLTQELGYQFSPLNWLHIMPFIGFGVESEVSTSPITYVTQAQGLAASIVVDDFVGWGFWGAAKYTTGADSFTDAWQYGGGVWFGI